MPSDTPPEPSRRVYTADAPATAPTGPRAFGLFVLVTDGKLYAVETADGYIPCRAIGPLTPADVPPDLSTLDWSQAADATTWNAARLVAVVPAELERLREGRPRGVTAGGRSPRMPSRIQTVHIATT